MSLEFLLPNRLWWLLVPIGLAGLYALLLMRQPALNSRGRGSRLRMVLPTDKAWKRHLAVATAVLSMVALVVAYAKPKDFTEVPRDRATVVLAIDVSRSMMAEDIAPNRMEAAQKAAKDFLQMLPPRFNVSLVAFAGTSSIVVPPTTDRGAVSRAIDNLQMAPSTAIGDGIYSSLNALKLVPPDPDHPDETAPAAVVLLSDGATNSGRPSAQAARDAKKQNVPVYTIAYGTSTGYIEEKGLRQPVPVNHRELEVVARESGGEKLSAASEQELQKAYESIARSIGYEKVFVEVTERYVGFGLLFAVAAALSLMSLAARWP